MCRVSIAILCVTLSLAAWQAAPGAEPLPPAARWIPQNALIVVELSDPEALLDLVYDPRMIEKVASVPAYERIISTPDAQQFFAVIRFLEASLGTDWRTALDKSIGGGITLAACPDDVALLIVDAKDGEMVPVSCGPIVKCECAESVTRGNIVGPDDGEAALIKPVTLTGGGTLRGVLGIALKDGDDGDVVPVLMKGLGLSFVG